MISSCSDPSRRQGRYGIIAVQYANIAEEACTMGTSYIALTSYTLNLPVHMRAPGNGGTRVPETKYCICVNLQVHLTTLTEDEKRA